MDKTLLKCIMYFDDLGSVRVNGIYLLNGKKRKMTLQHIGILFVIFGTCCIAFAVKYENKYTLSTYGEEQKNSRNIVKMAEDGTYLEPSIVIVDKRRFRLGLICVAVGSLLQW